MASKVRQNFHKECEEGVNNQINMEMYAMYTYLSMVSSDCRSLQAIIGVFVPSSPPISTGTTWLTQD